MTNCSYQDEHLVSHNNLTRFNFNQIPPCFQEWCLGLKFSRRNRKNYCHHLYCGLINVSSFHPNLEHNTTYCFVIFCWMKPTRLVEHALKASVQLDEENGTGTKYGYQVTDVWLDKPHRIEIGVSQMPLTSKHKMNVTSTLNKLSVLPPLIVPRCQL